MVQERSLAAFDLEPVLPKVPFGSSFRAYEITKFGGNERKA
jgi:hypothetical protein